MGRSVAEIIAEYEENNRPAPDEEKKEVGLTSGEIPEIVRDLNEQLKKTAQHRQQDRPKFVQKYQHYLRNRTKYFRTGNDRDEKVLGNPPLSTQQLASFKPTGPNGQKIYLDQRQKAIKLLQYEEIYRNVCKNGDKACWPPPFMEKLRKSVAARLADHFQVPPKQLRKTTKYYSTYNTVLDSTGTDFFYVLDGKNFEDKEDRFIKFDITDNPKKTNELYDKADPTAIIINFPKIARENGLGIQEASFLMAMTTSNKPADKEIRNNELFKERLEQLIAAIATSVVEELKRCSSKKPSERKIYTRSDIKDQSHTHLRRVI